MPKPVITPYVDGITPAAVGIDFEHHMIHRGLRFTAHYESEAPLPTLVGEETAIGFLTPSLPTRIHMIVDARADDESVLEIREAPTIVLAQGTAQLALNRDRSVGAALADRSAIIDREAETRGYVSVFTAVGANNADLSGGTILHHETLAIAAGPPFDSVQNAQFRGQREWILLPDTEYVVILTNLTANDTVHEIVLNWYELTHGDWAN